MTRLTIDALLGEDSGNEPALRVGGPSILGKLGSFIGAVTYSLKVGGRWALSPLAKVAPDVVHFWRLLWGRGEEQGWSEERSEFRSTECNCLSSPVIGIFTTLFSHFNDTF